MTLQGSSIFVNMKRLRTHLYRAQFAMTKANRIIYGTPLMEYSGKALAAFVLAFKARIDTTEKLRYRDECIGAFSVLRIDLENCMENNIIQFPKREGETPEDRVSAEKIELFRLVATIDNDMCKWSESLTKGKTICAEHVAD